MSAQVFISTDGVSPLSPYNVLTRNGRSLQEVIGSVCMLSGATPLNYAKDLPRVTVNDSPASGWDQVIVKGDFVKVENELETKQEDVEFVDLQPAETVVAATELEENTTEETVSATKVNVDFSAVTESLNKLIPHLDCLEKDITQLRKFKRDIAVEVEKSEDFLAAMQEHVGEFRAALDANVVTIDTIKMQLTGN
jgi:hypothetical protein